MASIFSKIIAGEIPAYVIKENENFMAFLDVFPVCYGHVLVIPKKEVDYIFDLDTNLYLDLMAFAKEIAGALKQTVPCKKIGVSVIGLEVPHAHVHLVPINSLSDMDFAKNKTKAEDANLKDLQVKIQGFL